MTPAQKAADEIDKLVEQWAFIDGEHAKDRALSIIQSALDAAVEQERERITKIVGLAFLAADSTKEK